MVDIQGLPPYHHVTLGAARMGEVYPLLNDHGVLHVARDRARTPNCDVGVALWTQWRW